MYVKFCESKYNLTLGCKTISLGTLESYTKDDPNFMRYDFNEGKFTVKNYGSEVYLNRDDTKSITSGRIIGDIKISEGANFNGFFNFPNCYIFCFGNYIIPNIENAKCFDPNYDSWYAITDINKFSLNIAKLLSEQLTINDLYLDINTEIEYLKNLSIQIIHKPIEYKIKNLHLKQENINEVKKVVDNPIDWVFQKDEKYSSMPEYRIAFLVTDKFGNYIPVKSENKIINLIPDLGISEIATK